MMNSLNEHDANELTFAQRMGEAPLPEPMRLKHVSTKFRQLVWLAIETAIQKDISDTRMHGLSGGIHYIAGSHIGRIFFNYDFEVRGIYHTEILGPDPQEDKKFAFDIIRNGKYSDVLTFIEHVLRDSDCPADLHKSLKDAFEKAPIAYSVMQTSDHLTVMPRVSKETSEAIRKAFKSLDDNGRKASVAHLHQAIEHINKQQYPDSIVDSIHAVESIACETDPNSNLTLGKALNSLEKSKIIQHPHLVKALHNLYAFASQPGLRHGLKNKGKVGIGIDEAMLMLGACACFAEYLANKHQKPQKQPNEDS